VTDLIQILDPHVAARAARHQQDADRLDVSIGEIMRILKRYVARELYPHLVAD
jgi:hypothetical protein